MGKENTNASCSTSQPEIEELQKLRVLCLHGYRQNGETFKSKLGAFRKFLKRYVEFVFISAPHKAAPLETGQDVDDNQRSWWFNKADHTFKGTNQNGPAFGYEESLRLVEQTWQQEGPFHGLMGFSQGACFVGLICGLAEKKLTTIRPEFAVIASGFMSGSLVHKGVYEETIHIPTLHIYGMSDDIIPTTLSEELSLRYKNIEVLQHPGGHYFPATAAQKQNYVDFFRDRLVEHLEQKELQKSGQSFYVEEKAEAEAEEEVNKESSD